MNKKELREEKFRRKKEFNKLYHTKILQVIDKYENSRKRQLKKILLPLILFYLYLFIGLAPLLYLIIFAIILVLDLIFTSSISSKLLNFTSSHYFLIFSPLVIFYFTYKWVMKAMQPTENIIKNYSYAVKNNIGNEILTLFDNIEYTNKSFEFQELVFSGLFPSFTSIEIDDSFVCNYKNSEILFSDVRLYTPIKEEEGLVFHGLVLSFCINKKFIFTLT